MIRIIVCFVLLTIQINSKIITIDKFSDILKIVNTSLSKPVIFTDVDYLLIHPKNIHFQMGAMLHYPEIVKKYMAELNDVQKDLFLRNIFKDAILVEKTDIKTIHALKRKMPVFGFISGLTGNTSIPDNDAAHKIASLKKIKLMFSKLQNISSPILIEGFKKHLDGFPLFKDGVLFTNGDDVSKAEILISFLKMGHLHFKTLIVADDKRDVLDAIEVALKKSYPEIQFLGIHCIAAHKFPTEMPTEVSFEKDMMAIVKKIQIESQK
jgi:hypothetical protein